MKTFNLFLSLFFVFSFVNLAQALEVQKIKDNKVLIDSGSDTLNPGDNYLLVNSSHKKIGLIKVTSAKTGKAIGEITKGVAEVGATLLKAKSTPPPPPLPTTTENSDGDAPPPKKSSKSSSNFRRKKYSYAVGGMIGYAQDSLSMTVNDGVNAPLSGSFKGTAISFKAFFDYNYTQTISFRAATGLEPFSVSTNLATAICGKDTTTACKATYNFIPLEISAHYTFLPNSNLRPWAGIGYSYLMGGSSTVTIPNLNSGGSNQMVLLSVGSNYVISRASFIPIVVEYGVFPGGSGVSSSAIFIRGGYGFSF